MTETKRTAAEIRAYCEAARGLWNSNEGITQRIFDANAVLVAIFLADSFSVKDVKQAESDATFVINARTDLPRVLDAAVKLREWLRKYELLLWKTGQPLLARMVEAVRDETAFLADSPQPPLSPDGESEEESET